ncbi:MAG: hypothetical protein ABL888_21080, partial [Pirellulaceae bacterium]
KRLGWSFLFVGVVLTLAMIVYIVRDRRFDPETRLPVRTPVENWYEQVRVGVVGDCWVTQQKLDGAIAQGLLAEGIHAEVKSSGRPGSKSRQVYRDLLAEVGTPFSSRHLLTDLDIDYLVVIVGVNDTAGHFGSDFYVHHLKQIIDLTLSQGIHPVIVEIPEYSIEDTPARGPLSFSKRRIYRMLFDGNQNNVIDSYRQALDRGLSASIAAQISIVRFGELTDDYDQSRDLYSNHAHLSKEGMRQFGALIARSIGRAHRARIESAACPETPSHGQSQQ